MSKERRAGVVSHHHLMPIDRPVADSCTVFVDRRVALSHGGHPDACRGRAIQLPKEGCLQPGSHSESLYLLRSQRYGSDSLFFESRWENQFSTPDSVKDGFDDGEKTACIRGDERED